MKLNYKRSVEVNCVNSSELFFTFEEWKQIDKNIDKRKQFRGFPCFRFSPSRQNKNQRHGGFDVKLPPREVSLHRQLVRVRE